MKRKWWQHDWDADAPARRRTRRERLARMEKMRRCELTEWELDGGGWINLGNGGRMRRRGG